LLEIVFVKYLVHISVDGMEIYVSVAIAMNKIAHLRAVRGTVRWARWTWRIFISCAYS